jgi:tetratricopeptide (TPR) repeat protein
MPAGMEWSMLSSDEKQRLRGLSKEHAENTGLHILAAYSLEEENPEQALEHAKWVARQASRVDIARETLAFISYRAGDYKTALKEFRTAHRMNGQIDYLPFIADCERGLGNPKKTIEIALSDEAKDLEGDSKAEMLLVFAGAYADLGHFDQAIKIVDTLGKSRGVSGGYRMRAVQAEQNFLDQAGRHDESLALEDELDRLEAAYADAEDDEEEDVIDNDLEEVPDSVLEGLGIDLTDFRGGSFDQYDEENEESESEELEESEIDDSDSDESDSDSDSNDEFDDVSAIEVADVEDPADDEQEPTDTDNTASDEILDDGTAEDSAETVESDATDDIEEGSTEESAQ